MMNGFVEKIKTVPINAKTSFKNFVLKIQNLPIKKQKLVGLSATLGLLVTLPLLVWGLVALNFNLSEKAATGEPTPTPSAPPFTSDWLPHAEFTNENFDDTFLTTSISQKPTNDFTVEAWVKIPRPSSGNYIREYPLVIYNSAQAPGTYGYIFKLNLEVQESSGQYTPSFSVLKNSFSSVVNSNYISANINDGTMFPPDTWAHVAGVFYSQNGLCVAEIYVNGQQKAHTEAGNGIDNNCLTLFQNPIDITIGKPQAGAGGISGFYFNGQIDGIRLSNIRRYTPTSTYTDPYFSTDPNTLSLFHFSYNLDNLSGNGSSAILTGAHFGYMPNLASPTPTVIPTQSPTPSPFPTPPTPTSSPTVTSTPIATPTAVSTPVANNIPVLGPFNLPTAHRKKSYYTVVTGQDKDFDDINITFTGLPTWLKPTGCVRFLYNISCPLSGTPNNLFPKLYRVTATISDNRGGSSSATSTFWSLPR